ncbi:MAG: leucine-rich repeat domain-containing protein [Clostridia bacterium]|nr:leucine-rich repeat domain-containing protein [Clostridia bacterium]
MKNRIEAFEFSNNDEISDIVIPENIVSIGEYAFADCKNLKNVVLPSRLENIGKGAFRGCTSLEMITIPSEVDVIAPELFNDCVMLERINLSGNKFKSVFSSAFFNSGYYRCKKNWRSGLLYFGDWVIACDCSYDDYLVKAGTVGIAENVFCKKKSFRTVRNPEYDEMLGIMNMAIECPNMPLPDISDIPEYKEISVPIQIRYQGTTADFRNIIMTEGVCGTDVLVTASDGTFDFVL